MSLYLHPHMVSKSPAFRSPFTSLVLQQSKCYCLDTLNATSNFRVPALHRGVFTDLCFGLQHCHLHLGSQQLQPCEIRFGCCEDVTSEVNSFLLAMLIILFDQKNNFFNLSGTQLCDYLIILPFSYQLPEVLNTLKLRIRAEFQPVNLVKVEDSYRHF